MEASYLLGIEGPVRHSKIKNIGPSEYVSEISLSVWDEIKVTLKVDGLPLQSRKFIVGHLDEQLTISLTQLNAEWNVTQGQEVFLFVEENEDYLLKFCDLEFEYARSGNTIKASGSIKLN